MLGESAVLFNMFGMKSRKPLSTYYARKQNSGSNTIDQRALSPALQSPCNDKASECTGFM